MGVLCLTLLINGCSVPDIQLYNDQTKLTAECRGDAWSSWDPWGDSERCAQRYEKVGFRRLN